MGRTWSWEAPNGDEISFEYRPGGTVNVAVYLTGDKDGLSHVYVELFGLPMLQLVAMLVTMLKHETVDRELTERERTGE
jgi:hypothetical protein